MSAWIDELLISETNLYRFPEAPGMFPALVVWVAYIFISRHTRLAPASVKKESPGQCPGFFGEKELLNVRYWHLADNPTPLEFVRYWSNSGHWSALALNGWAANDPKWTLLNKLALCLEKS